jgi:tetratricopeptide (TPR) repeat protein
MRDFAFDSPEQYELETLMASFHNIVLEFLRSDRVCYVATSRMEGLKQESDGDTDWKEVQTWRDWTLSSGQLAYEVRLDFYHVWLNTNWRELDLAKWVVRAAMALDHVLKNMPASQHVKKTQGWKSRYVPYDQPRTTVDAVENVAALADFNDQVGIQVGNYAFGFLVANSEECVRRFQEALDEFPEYWHLHEGLAEYYADHDQREKAIASLEKALEVDTKEFHSAAFTHATLVAKTKEDVDDLDGAVEALKEGLKRSPERDAYKYWDAMAKIFEERGNGNSMIEIYKEAVKKHPKAGSIFWEKLADTYRRGGARQQEWYTFREAIDKDPENRHKYGEEIRKLHSS